MNDKQFIEKLTAADLEDLILTLYGNEDLYFDGDTDPHRLFQEGGTIKVATDNDIEIYGTLRNAINRLGDRVYFVSLEDIQRGLKNALDGNFKANGEEDLIAAYGAFTLFKSGEFDVSDASVLWQIILFNEIVYTY
jgi:hypothetical protein